MFTRKQFTLPQETFQQPYTTKTFATAAPIFQQPYTTKTFASAAPAPAMSYTTKTHAPAKLEFSSGRSTGALPESISPERVAGPAPPLIPAKPSIIPLSMVSSLIEQMRPAAPLTPAPAPEVPLVPKRKARAPKPRPEPRPDPPSEPEPEVGSRAWKIKQFISKNFNVSS